MLLSRKHALLLVAPWTYNPSGAWRWAGLVLKESEDVGHEGQWTREGVFLGPGSDDDLDGWESKIVEIF